MNELQDQLKILTDRLTELEGDTQADRTEIRRRTNALARLCSQTTARLTKLENLNRDRKLDEYTLEDFADLYLKQTDLIVQALNDIAWRLAPRKDQ